MGRPGLSPGIYFRLLMVGYFEGIDSERGIAWRASDSLSIRSFVRIALDEMQVSGIETNLLLHRKLAQDPDFITGGVDIHHLERWLQQEGAA